MMSVATIQQLMSTFDKPLRCWFVFSGPINGPRVLPIDPVQRCLMQMMWIYNNKSQFSLMDPRRCGRKTSGA